MSKKPTPGSAKSAGSGFSAEEFEPTALGIVPDDDADDAGAGPGAGHNRQGKPSLHAKVAEALLGLMTGRGQALRNIHDQKNRTHLWYFGGELWALLPEPVKWLNCAIEVTLRVTGKADKSKDRLVTEVRKYIERNPNIMEPNIVKWDTHGKVPTRSGLLDPVTLKLEPYRMEHYATWRLDLDYDPDAKCPLWLELLDDYFVEKSKKEREQLVVLLQDYAGTTLIDELPKALERGLVLQGASDTGKSVILRVLSAILWDGEPNSTALSEIGKTHGLEEFLFRRPWVLDEAFENNVWFLSAIVKAILAREPVGINQKNIHLITKRVIAPVLWGTNHPPAFKESTEAMVNRLLIVLLTRVFDKDNPVGVAAKAKAINPAWEPHNLILDRERNGVFTWMMAGLQRVLERGYFVNTEEGKAMLVEMRMNANPVAGFVRDCIEYDVDAMISTADFHAAFTGWRLADHGDEKINFSRAALGRYLSALADPKILQDKLNFKKRDCLRFYVGIRLNEQGAAHFEEVAARQILAPDLKFQGMSATKEATRQPIPTEWLVLPKVELLRRGFVV